MELVPLPFSLCLASHVQKSSFFPHAAYSNVGISSNNIPISLSPPWILQALPYAKTEKDKKEKKKETIWLVVVGARWENFEHSPDLSEAVPGKRGLSFFGNNTNMNVILASREDRVWRVSQGKERPLRRLNGGVVDVS